MFGPKYTYFGHIRCDLAQGKVCHGFTRGNALRLSSVRRQIVEKHRRSARLVVANCKTPASDQSERSFSEEVNYVSGDLVDQEYAIPTKIRPAEKYAAFLLTREGGLSGACSLL